MTAEEWVQQVNTLADADYPELNKLPAELQAKVAKAAVMVSQYHGWEPTPANFVNAIRVMDSMKILDQIVSPEQRQIYADREEFLATAPLEKVKEHLQPTQQEPPLDPQTALQRQREAFLSTAPVEAVQAYLSQENE